MSGKWPGGFINKTAPTVVGPTDGEGGSASGIWTLDQVADYESKGLWPAATLSRIMLTWGSNNNGQIGDGTITNRSSPVQVGALTTWAFSSGGNASSYGIKQDGTLWAWGSNGSGQLGVGSTTAYSSPVQVGALTTWSKISGGMYHTLAVKTDGTLWAFGRNNLGQLGDGTTVDKSSPVQIGALTTWSKPIAGYNSSYAIKTDGGLWSWGMGTYYCLGLGNNTNYSSPVQVGALTDWLDIAGGSYQGAVAVKTDGSMWSWGNGVPILGQNNTTTYDSPVQIGSLTTWLKIASGYGHALAVKTDGTLWIWGNATAGGQGALGQGALDYTGKSSPIQVGALTTWLDVAGCYYSSYGTTTSNELYVWGQNNQGQLGANSADAKISSPVQVGAETYWKTLPKTPVSNHQVVSTNRST